MTASPRMTELVDAFHNAVITEKRLELARAALLQAIAEMETMAANVPQLLGVIELVRYYPDFDNGKGPLVKAMDEALQGKSVTLLHKIARWQAGLSASDIDDAARSAEGSAG